MKRYRAPPPYPPLSHSPPSHAADPNLANASPRAWTRHLPSSLPPPPRALRLLPAGGPRLALGCMRLSTERDRDDARGRRAARGARCRHHRLRHRRRLLLGRERRGHNERLIAQAWQRGPAIGPASRRDQGRPDAARRGVGCGRPGPPSRRRVRAQPAGAGRRTDRALPVARPRSANAARDERPRAGVAEARGVDRSIGLCNVTVGQIEEARRIAEIDAVQVELSVWKDAEHPERGRRVLRRTRHPRCWRTDRSAGRGARRPSRCAARRSRRGHGATPLEIALAWLPICLGGRRRTPGRHACRDDAIGRRAASDRLDRRRIARSSTSDFRTARDSSAAARPAGDRDRGRAEVVLIMGLPGAGKTTWRRRMWPGLRAVSTVTRRAARSTTLVAALETGDRLGLVAGRARQHLCVPQVAGGGDRRVVAGFAVRCVWLSTTVEDAQVNAVSRIVSPLRTAARARGDEASRKL